MDTKDNTNSIRYRLLELRGEESQQDLADAIGVSRSLVKAWESGDRKIKIDDLISLSKHFHVSADYLLGMSDAKTDDRDIKYISDYTGLNAATIAKFHRYAHLRGHDSEILANFDSFIDLFYERFLHRLLLLRFSLSSAKEALEDPKCDERSFNLWLPEVRMNLYLFSSLCSRIPEDLFHGKEITDELEKRASIGELEHSIDLEEFLEYGDY